MSRPSALVSDHDDRLLARVQSREQDALVLLYHRWAGFVYALALAMTDSPAAATEITYDVFMAFLAEPPNAHAASGTLRARMAATTHSRAIRHVRTDRPDEVGDEADRLQLARCLTRAAGLRGAASLAQPDQRLALTITYLAGHTFGDAARILGLSRAAVVRQVADGLRMIALGRPG